MAILGEITDGAYKQTYKFTYNFSVNGGAQGTIALTPQISDLPSNFVIQNAFLDVITPLGSSGAAVAAVTTGQLANDLVVATIIAGAPFQSAGVKATIPLIATIASWLKTTATRTPAIVVSIADLNSGRFNLFIEGFTSA